MRTVLLGSDFMYDKDGNLKPIEINTNVSFSTNKIEDDTDIYDITNLKEFITSNGFLNLHYIGGNKTISDVFSDMADELSISYEYRTVRVDSITIPYIEDNDTTLIIRSAYDTTALVDDTYCRDKINFLNLIKDSTFGCQFAYLDGSNTLVNNITTIPDNGIHPNFILKCRYPNYDKNVYPKLYKVSSLSELDTIIANNVTGDYFLMEYYFNDSKKHNNQITKIRTLNILYPPTLQSISIGQYTDLTSQFIPTEPIYNTMFELDTMYRNAYITETADILQPKLLDTDQVQMADGSWKTALELEVGDLVKSITVPNVDNDAILFQLGEYTLPIADFMAGVVYTTNTITHKKKVNKLTNYSTITFTDNTTWEDTANSFYLVERNNTVIFTSIATMIAGDLVILIDSSDLNVVSTTTKEVVSVVTTSQIFSGWIITVEDKHIFLTRTEDTNNSISFAAIEHNYEFCTGPGSCTRNSCWSKSDVCTGEGYCWPYPRYCL